MAVAGKGKEHAVVVFEDSQVVGSRFKAAPGTLLAQKGDLISFQNITSVNVVVEFAGRSPLDVNSFPLKPGGKLDKQVQKVPAGGYPYDAFCGVKQEPAHASRPIIIVYD